MNDTISLTQAFVLALVQGATEFLPISSSAHLALLPKILHLPDQGLAFDTTVHLGTLLAILLVMKKEVACMAQGFLRTLRARNPRADADGWLAWLVLVATIPVAIAGLLLHDLVEHALRNPLVIGLASAGFGALLWWADRQKAHTRTDWGLREAMLVGAAQVLALIPGTSRSGITMTAALWLGYSRTEAARFSFLLAIPVIALAGGYNLVKWFLAPASPVGAAALATGFVVSFVSAYLVARALLACIARIGMAPFALYRIVLGAWLLVGAA